MNTFSIRVDGERAQLRLYSLAEYEIDGGIYDDTGNGGERFNQAERGQFIAAATVAPNDTGLSENELLDLAGCNDYWYDSATDYYLLREWPAEAPLQARLLG